MRGQGIQMGSSALRRHLPTEDLAGKHMDDEYDAGKALRGEYGGKVRSQRVVTSGLEVVPHEI
jgi:hypothetical protein